MPPIYGYTYTCLHDMYINIKRRKKEEEEVKYYALYIYILFMQIKANQTIKTNPISLNETTTYDDRYELPQSLKFNRLHRHVESVLLN